MSDVTIVKEGWVQKRGKRLAGLCVLDLTNGLGCKCERESVRVSGDGILCPGWALLLYCSIAWFQS